MEGLQLQITEFVEITRISFCCVSQKERLEKSDFKSNYAKIENSIAKIDVKKYKNWLTSLK